MPSAPGFYVSTVDSNNGRRLLDKMRAACPNPLNDPVLFEEPEEGDVIFVDGHSDDDTCTAYLSTNRDDSEEYTFFAWELELLGIECIPDVFFVRL